MPENGMHTKVFSDDGVEIKGITSINVSVSVNDPLVTASIDLLFAEAEIAPGQTIFYVGSYANVRKLILDNGDVIDLFKPVSC
jgi:hypothetical protein